MSAKKPIAESTRASSLNSEQAGGQIEPSGACVIMASGLGKRFGGNKLMADFGGKPMIARAFAVTEGLFRERVVVTRHADVAECARAHGVAVVLHELPYRSDTVRLGMEVIGAEVDTCMFLPGDQPLLTRESLVRLVMCAKREPEFIWRTVYEEQVGAPMIFPKHMFSELRSLPEGKGGSFLAKKYPESVHTVSVGESWELRDVDSTADYRELLGLWREMNNN